MGKPTSNYNILRPAMLARMLVPLNGYYERKAAVACNELRVGVTSQPYFLDNIIGGRSAHKACAGVKGRFATNRTLRL